MGIFSWFGNLFSSPSEFEQSLAKVKPRLVKEYRRIAAERGIAPTKKTSDKKIVEIYFKVAEEFMKVAEQRNEDLPLGYINHLALYFFLVYEKFCGENKNEEAMFDMQLDYELRKYLKEGLRETLRQDLDLFKPE